jgi:quinol monooxygenase YgiN
VYALIVRFEVKADRLEEFDALVAATLVGIRDREPGTLLYFTSTTDASPTSRVFVEVYADEEAFRAHEEQPHTQSFLQAREELLDSYRVEFVRPIEGAYPAWSGALRTPSEEDGEGKEAKPAGETR